MNIDKNIFNTDVAQANSFATELIYGQLQARVNLSHQQKSTGQLTDCGWPNQTVTSLCGPAAFFYCLLKDRPDLYEQAVKELLHKGRTTIVDLNIDINNTAVINPKDAVNGSNSAQILAIDWITLASLRQQYNRFCSLKRLKSQFAGITGVKDIKKWFKALGYKSEYEYYSSSIINNGFSFKSILGIPKLLFPSRDIQTLIELNKAQENNKHVVLLINNKALLLNKKPLFNLPTHWIVLEGAIYEKKTGKKINASTPMGSQIVGLKIFTWGKVRDYGQTLTVRELLKYIHGILVFDKMA